ncbi:MAG: DUF6442 family protein [Lachnospiraceae bacterium]|nr:DUF6442 family protein [Lachnospiraceae bacterium]
MDQHKIGEFLKTLRKEKGITQEQAAEHFGVAGRTISRWETGSNMPDLSLLIEIATFYDVEVGEILDGERKSENMIKENVNNEMKETLEKVADYNVAIQAKSMKIGVIAMAAMSVVIMILAMIKGMSTTPIVILLCAYNGATFLSRARQTKEQSALLAGSMFLLAMVMNIAVLLVR